MLFLKKAEAWQELGCDGMSQHAFVSLIRIQGSDVLKQKKTTNAILSILTHFSKWHISCTSLDTAQPTSTPFALISTVLELVSFKRGIRKHPFSSLNPLQVQFMLPICLAAHCFSLRTLDFMEAERIEEILSQYQAYFSHDAKLHVNLKIMQIKRFVKEKRNFPEALEVLESSKEICKKHGLDDLSFELDLLCVEMHLRI